MFRETLAVLIGLILIYILVAEKPVKWEFCKDGQCTKYSLVMQGTRKGV